MESRKSEKEKSPKKSLKELSDKEEKTRRRHTSKVSSGGSSGTRRKSSKNSGDPTSPRVRIDSKEEGTVGKEGRESPGTERGVKEPSYGNLVVKDSRKSKRSEPKRSKSTSTKPVSYSLKDEKEVKEHKEKKDGKFLKDEEIKRMNTPLITKEELEIKELIGKGACGSVCKGALRGTVVAVKRLKSKYENAEQFDREVGIMIQIRHPNVVLFMGACYDPPYIVTEYLEGGDLLEWIAKNKKLLENNQTIPVNEMLKISIDIAKGMAWLHQFKPQPIIHKDLKPTNIMLDSKGNAKIIDFGLSEVQKQREMENRRFAGSASWMSPEMLLGRSYTEKIDVYAYGIILWQIFTSTTEVYDIRRYQNIPPSAAIQKFIHEIVTLHMRPEITTEFRKTHSVICSVIEMSWHGDYQYRPSFKQIIETLTPTLLQTVLKDHAAIQMWREKFPDKEAVGLNQFLTAVWNTLYNKDLPHHSHHHHHRHSHNHNHAHPVEVDDTEEDIKLRCLETVIKGPYANMDTVSLERFGLLLHWYGPFCKSPDNPKDMLDKIAELLRKPFFHGEISGAEAEELLNTSSSIATSHSEYLGSISSSALTSPHSPAPFLTPRSAPSVPHFGGDFLIRCSLNPVSPLTISRLQINQDNTQKSVVHHRIGYNAQHSYYFMQYQSKNTELKEIQGKTLDEFVENAKPVLIMKNPVECTKFLSVFDRKNCHFTEKYALAVEDL